MASLNKIQLIGHLGQDPEVRYLPDGTPVANFSVATSERWTDNAGEKHEKTEWHRIEAWGRLAEIMKNFAHRGDQVYVEGSISTDKYTDKEQVVRYATKVRAQIIQLLDRRKADQGAGQNGDGHDGHNSQDDSGYASGAAGDNAQAAAGAQEQGAPGAAQGRKLFKPRATAGAGAQG